MMPTIRLMVRFATSMIYLDNCCISMRFEKERYTPYTELHGQWYCPAGIQIGEIVSVMLYINNNVLHYGYPSDIELLQKDGRTVLSISSVGYTAALLTNQCPDGLITDINLQGLAAKNAVFPVVAYQQDTPTVNYVNYYNGTSAWEAIVCYSLRATEKYPYIQGYNTVRVNPPENRGYVGVTSAQLISRGNITDYKRIISRINEKDVDGTPDAFSIANSSAAQRTIVRSREINFDREWIMDPAKGLRYRIDYSMRAINCDVFSYLGYNAFDLLDSFAITDLSYVGEIDRFRITASADKGIITTVWCYHDNYCPCV